MTHDRVHRVRLCLILRHSRAGTAKKPLTKIAQGLQFNRVLGVCPTRYARVLSPTGGAVVGDTCGERNTLVKTVSTPALLFDTGRSPTRQAQPSRNPSRETYVSDHERK